MNDMAEGIEVEPGVPGSIPEYLFVDDGGAT
jgi:hypothetical protein